MDEHINVSVRLRPLSQDEVSGRDRPAVSKQKDGTLLLHDIDGISRISSYSRVFDESASNQEVFDGVVANMLEHALLGKNATLFAYGQTGSGKTYTMEGMMFAAAEFLFAAIANTPDKEFLLKMSAVEVYNETVHDLLHRGNFKLDLIDNRDGKTVVKNMAEETLLSAVHLQRMLRRVRENRKVRETSFNVQSSRSHQLVTVTVESRDRSAVAADSAQLTTTVAGDLHDKSGVKHSIITFVDLAGSEPSSSHSLDYKQRPGSANIAEEKLRKRESAKINQSLLALARVIQHLADGQGKSSARQHVPFRDSNLTRLLQPCLGGNSKTAIVGTVSPSISSLENSRATLNFISIAAKVQMRPVVNVVDDKNSRIRTLEQEVRMLRSELAAKESQNQLESDPSSTSANDVTEALQAQMQRNEDLTKEKESLARKIAGLERLVLNADPLWRAAQPTNTLNKSIDVDELPLRVPSTATDSDTPSRRISAITQSMPVFNRTAMDNLGSIGASRLTPNYDVLRPSSLYSIGKTPGSSDIRPATASGFLSEPPKPRYDRQLSEKSGQGGFEDYDEPAAAHARDSSSIPSSLSLHTKDEPTPRTNDNTPLLGDVTPRVIQAVTTPRGPKPALKSGPGIVPPLWSKMQSKPEALDLVKLSPRLMAMAPVSERGENAVSELMSEVRNVRFGGQPGVESEQLRLARLEVQLQTLQEHQEDGTDSIADEAEGIQQDIQDLQDEISRLKAARLRKQEALNSLAHLRNNIKQLTKQIRDEGPEEASEQEVKDLVREQALPEWMGHVLTENCTSALGCSGAIAPVHEDDGEVVTSRERSLPRADSAASSSVSISTDATDSDYETDSVTSPGAKPSYAQPTPRRDPVSISRESQQRFIDTPRPSSRLHNTTTSAVSNSATKPEMPSGGTPSVQSQSLGSSGDPDDEIKAIMARAVHGLKAQEAIRFKQHMNRMEARVKELAESHVANLQNVLQNYQEANETLEEQKKWLVVRILQQESDIQEQERTVQELRDQIVERDARISSLDNELRQARTSAAAKVNEEDLEDASFLDTIHSSWGKAPSVSDLLTSIVQLWHEMHVPLLTRSQFWLTHQGKDVFYYLAEQGHLLDEKREMENNPDMLRQATARMHQERKWLAQRLKEVYTEEEREQLFNRWGISQIKERKKALSLRLWDPLITDKVTGQKSSAELTLLLYGWDASDTSFVGIMHKLPYADVGRVTLAAQSTRLVSKAATYLTPRATPPRSARLKRQNTPSNADDMSVNSMPIHSNRLQ